MNKMIDSMTEALQLLKKGYTLIIVENKTAVCFKNNYYFLINENWHSKLREEDFADTFSKNKFIIYEKSNDGDISLQKDEEYYQWRNKYL